MRKIQESIQNMNKQNQYNRKHQLTVEQAREKVEFEAKLLRRRAMIYPEYNLEKLWRDSKAVQIKNCMDFVDTSIEDS